ncbi:nephrocystin-4 [Gadus macrocephalus]|uniref:nephrocystin-4 n=1 Tax=Gadus macrocephalus TaxID=80720 RepID=UPI0028CB2F3E|nr:nephrocystin-4 [Gadus macrocephalus]
MPSVQFRVDDGFLKAGERRWFLGYLAQQTLQVDVWDSASLLLVGSCCVPLKHMLRQGRSAVQALHELEVLATEYASEETPLHLGGEGGPNRGSGGHHQSLVNINTVLRGRLYVRTGNIGCLVDPDWRRPGEVPPPCSYVITQRESGAGGFKGGKLSTGNILRLNERNASLAQQAATAAAADITGGGPEVITDGVGPPAPGESVEDRRRKLSCLAAVLQREAREHPESQVKTARVMSRREERVQLARDLDQIRALQDRSKAEAISSMLSQAITTRHALYASLGTAEYLEFILRNPFSAPHTVSIHSADPDLSVISSVEEWSHFRALTRSPTPVEENLFQVEEGSPHPRVYLRPRESVHIPLKYQSFVCDHSPPLQGPGFPSSGRQEDVARKHTSNIVRAKSIKVTFRAEDGQPLAVLQVDVEPTPHLVAHTFRLYHPQLCLLKKALRIPPGLASAPGSADGAEEEILVRCSDPGVVCQTKMLAPGEPQDVYMKVPGNPSPDVKMFYIMLFTDRWLARPASIWRVYVHFLERVELSCVAGQRTVQSLVLRGSRAPRKVRCYCSHPRQLEVDPAGLFVLPPAGAVQELQVRVQPWRSGSRLAFVSAVDVERCQLLAAWMVCLNAHRPVLSKAFELSVPVAGGRGSTRRITYTNPYPDTRTFLLHSDRPDLLQFKEDRFQVGGGEVYTVGLRFAPSQSGGSTEVSIYINNLDEKTEEAFCLKVNYS